MLPLRDWFVRDHAAWWSLGKHSAPIGVTGVREEVKIISFYRVGNRTALAIAVFSDMNISTTSAFDTMSDKLIPAACIRVRRGQRDSAVFRRVCRGALTSAKRGILSLIHPAAAKNCWSSAAVSGVGTLSRAARRSGSTSTPSPLIESTPDDALCEELGFFR